MKKIIGSPIEKGPSGGELLDVQVRGSNDLINASVMQSTDSAILFAGRFTQFNGKPASRIARLNYDGTTDTNFVSGTGFNAAPTSLLITNDIIVAAGEFTSYNGTIANHIVGLTKTGSIHSGFQTGTGFDDAVTSLALQSDGKIIVAGKFTHYNGVAVNHVLRLLTNGTPDTNFIYNESNFSGLKNHPDVVAVRQKDKNEKIIDEIILAFTAENEVKIYKLLQDGNFSLSSISIKEDTSPETYLPDVLSLLSYPDGSMLIGGVYRYGNSYGTPFLKRVNTNTTTDNTFTEPFDRKKGGAIQSLNRQADGKVIIGGKIDMGDNGRGLLSTCLLLRLNANGTLDNSFAVTNALREVNLGVSSTVIMNDGKIVASGFFSKFNNQSVQNMVKLYADGSVDTSFS